VNEAAPLILSAGTPGRKDPGGVTPVGNLSEQVWGDSTERRHRNQDDVQQASVAGSADVVSGWRQDRRAWQTAP